MIKFFKHWKDREDHDEDVRLSEEIREQTRKERAKTPEIAAQTRYLAEVRARNHFVEQLTLGFSAKTREG